MKSSASTYDPNKDGTTGIEKIVYTGTGNPHSSLRTSVSPYGTPGLKGSGAIGLSNWTAYTCPASVHGGLWCEVPGDRNTMYGLRQYNMDAAVSKNLKFGERMAFTVQVAFFNVDGHVEWNDPSGDLNSTNFGKSTSTITRNGDNSARQGQLSARFDF